MKHPEYPPLFDREISDGADSVVYKDGAWVVHVYYKYQDKPDLVWDYAGLVNQVAALGVLTAGLAEINGLAMNFQVSHVPVERQDFVETTLGQIPATWSQYIAGPTSFGYEPSFLTAEQEMIETGVDLSEIERLRLLHEAIKRNYLALKPLEDLIFKTGQVLTKVLGTRRLILHAPNYKFRMPKDNQLDVFLTDLSFMGFWHLLPKVRPGDDLSGAVFLNDQ